VTNQLKSHTLARLSLRRREEGEWRDDGLTGSMVSW